MTRAAVLATITGHPTRPRRLNCDHCGSIGWLHLVDDELLCDTCDTPSRRRDLPRAVPAPTAVVAVMACGSCGTVVDLHQLRWRNRRTLHIGCQFCTPMEDPCP
ncbi:hypothetical protein [Pseudonocardia sp.]|uniref:hypothetical protein n=1 Tax=Pseudonocardia sp. TaxID=60912 RepID=UPI003D0EE3D5